MFGISRQEVQKELLLFAATVSVTAGYSCLPKDGNVGSIKEIAVGVGLILLGVLIYFLRGYYKNVLLDKKK